MVRHLDTATRTSCQGFQKKQPERKPLFSSIHSRLVVHSHQGLGEADRELVDGDHHVADGGGASGTLAPPQVHRELLEGAVAVGHQVVLARAGELEDVAVKGLEVLAAPGAADAADVVPNWERWVTMFVNAEIAELQRDLDIKELENLRTGPSFLPSRAWTSIRGKARTHNHTLIQPMVAAVVQGSADQLSGFRLLCKSLYRAATPVFPTSILLP